MKLSRHIRFGLGVGYTFFFTMTPMAGANPTGAEVAIGSAAFDAAGSALSITTATDRTVINWNSFSIGTGQITSFIQPNASSAVLNRVIGSMPSEIAGQLVSNGRVGLLNPNGILITQAGSINTNGFTASTLNLSDDDFMGSGILTFKGDSEAVVSNSGTILARQGDVFLIGRTVANSGTIEARDGNVALAAGSEITLQKAGDGRMSVTVPASSKKGGVSHSGTIKAVQQQLRDNGGNPYVLGMNVDSGAEMSPQDFMNAQVAINAGRGRAEVSGTVAAGTQAKGGEVQVAGGEVAVKAGARLDVSGDRSGGTIQVGGGFQGQDTSITNSRTTSVESGSTFTADSRIAGDGGKVILWSDGATAFQGMISAKGGALGGNGGFAEVSGKQWLGFGGLADLSAARGATGTLLLDPTDIILNGAGVDAAPTFGAFGGGDPSVFNGGANNASTISIGTGAGDVNPTLLKQLASANVVISTTSAGGGTGNITVNGPIGYAGGNGLTLNAGNNLTLNFAITNAGTGALNLVAANAIALNAGLSTLGAVSLSHGGALTRTAGTLTASTLNLTGAGAATTGVGADVLTTNVANIVLNKTAGNSFIVETNGVDISGTTGGGANLTAVGNITQAGSLSVTGTTTLAAGAGDITLANTGNNFATVTIASANIVTLVDSNALELGDVTATSLTTHSGAGGSGDTTFAAAGTISADSQSYRAGNGFGGGTTAKVVTSTGDFGNTAGTDSPATFIHWQDASIANADITSLSKFVGTVPAAYTLRSDDGSITITNAGKIDGSNLLLDARTDLTIGDAPTLTSLDATAGTTITLSADVTSTGLQIYRSSLTLAGDTELQGSVVTTEGVVTGAGNDLTITGNAVFGNAGADTLTGLGALEVTGLTTLNASAVTTTAGQIYGGTVTLGAGTALTGTSLALAAGGIVGAGNDLAVDFSTAITLPGNIAGVGNFTSQKAVNVNGSFTTSGSQTYNAAVTLTGDSSLTGTALTLAAGITGAGNNLILDFSTPITLPGNLTGIGNFTSQKAVNVNGSFTTSGSQTYNAAVTLTGNSSLTGTALTLAAGITGGGNNLTLDFSTPFTLPGNIAGVGNFTSQKAVNVNGSFTTSGSQTYNAAVTLTGNSSLTGTALTLAAGGIVGANNALTLDFSTPITLPGNIAGVGNFTSQQAVNVNGSFTTSGSQTYNALVTLTGDSVLTGTALTLATGIAGGGNNLTLDFSTPFVLPGTITGVDDFISEKAIQINGSFTTTGSQRYKGAVETGLASALAGSSVRFDNKLSVAGDSTAGSLTIAGDLILAPTSTLYLTLGGTAAGTFDQIVVTGAGNDVTVSNATLDGEAAHSYSVGNEVTIIAKPAGNVIGTFASGSTASIGGQGFDIDYTDSPPAKNITLTRAVSTWIWDGGDNSGIDNLWSLKKNWENKGVPASGDIVVFDKNDDTEQKNDLLNLNLDRIIFKAGADSFKLTGNAVTLANGIVNESNNLQTVALPITLAGNQAFNTTGTGALVVGDALATVSGAVDLTLSGSNRITLGGATTLNSLTANSPTGLGNVTVTTSVAGGQVYNGAVTLVGNTVLNAGAGAITFAGTVNGGFSLDANTTGVTTFGGNVGNGTALTSLVTNAGGTTAINGGLIRTSAAAGQVFNDAVTLGDDAVLDAGAGAVTFIDTLNGLFGLTVNATGATTFGGVVGGTDRLTYLTTNAGGTVVFSGGQVRTSGPQSYGDAVVTAMAMNLDAGTGSITAVNPLNDFPQPLTLTGGIAQVTDANGLTLATLATGNLTATATGALNLGTGTVTGALSATSNGGPISQAAGGLTVTGTSTVNAGAGTITLTDPNNDFQDAVSLTGAASQIVDKNALRFGVGSVASLAATAGGSVDQTGALTVVGVTTVEVTAPGSDILLHTAANDFGGAVSVIGTQTNVRDFGIRNINAGATIPALTGLTGLRNLFIEFNNIGVPLPAINASGNATIISGGAITDTGAISVGGTASFTGTAVTLGAGLFNVGTLTFNSAGNVTIVEDSTMNIVGANTAGITTLTSTAGISDAGATSVNVGALIASAPSIALGGGIFNATSVNFISPGAVVIAEDSGMDLVGINTADSATLSATGVLSDAAATSVTIAGLGSFNGGSINLGGGTFNAGTLTFNSAGAVTISEDSSMDLAGVNTGGLTTLTSAIGIFDAGATSVTVDDLVVNAPVISLGGGVLNANTVNFNSAGAVVIAEDSGMNLVGVNTAGIANLSSTGILSDAGATSVTVVGLGSFNGGSISLGGGTFNVGTLTFNSAGSVAISEDSSMDIVGVNTATGTTLTSTVSISDAGATSVNVGALIADAPSITLGGGIFNATSVNFNSAGQVTISEDSAMDIVGVNTAAGTTLTSTVGISDAGATSVNVGALIVNAPSIALGGGIFNATTVNFSSVGPVIISEDSGMDIVGVNTAGSAALSSTGILSDAGATSVTVTGLGSFSGSVVTLGGGIFNVGTLNFNSVGQVTIDEDSATELAGLSTAGDLLLTSAGAISDATNTSLLVANNSIMTANGGPITLNETAGDILTVGGNAAFTAPAIAIGAAGTANFGTLTFNSAGAVVIAEDSGMDLIGANTAGSATLSATGALSDALAASVTVTGLGNFSGSTITLGGGLFNVGTLTFNSVGNVTIIEDSDTALAGSSTAGDLQLTSSGAIADATGTSLVVTNGSVMTANGGPITLNDSAGDVLTVGANARFTGPAVAIGSAGTANFGTLTFSSAGLVEVQEDSDMELIGINTASRLVLGSAGALTDAAGTSLTVTTDSAMSATGPVTLANTAGDILTVAANATFAGSAVNVGISGAANFGTLTFNSTGNVVVLESSGMLVSGSSQAGTLRLESSAGAAGTIGFAGTADPGGPATATAGGPITLLASGGINHFAGSTITTTGTFDSETATGNITMADGSSINATQDIRLNSPGNITLGSVTTAGNARIVAAGDIIDAQADTVGHDTRSFATLIGTRTVNITGAGAYLEAGGRIGATDDNPLDVNVAALATRSTGDTAILASGGISLRQVSTTVQRLDLSSAPTPLAESSSATVAAQSTAGDVRIETINGSLSADLPANARQDLLLLANGTGANLLLNSNLTADDDIGLRAANSVTSGAVNIHATGVTAVVPNGGTIDIEAFNGNVNLISGSTVSTVNGHIRVAAESTGGVVSVANLTGPDLVVLMGDGDVNANAVTGIGLYAESRTGSINLTTHVDEFAARAPGNITIHELDGLSIGLTGGDRKVDRVALDNSASEVSALVSLGSGIGIDSATGSLNLTTGGTLSQTAIIRVNQGLVTLDSGAANDIRLTLPNELNRLTVTNAFNVAIKDIDSGDADGGSYGLMLEGINTFTGTGFAVATEGGMRFVPGTRINGPANSKVVLIAGSAEGMPGINEISGNKQPNEDESLVNLDPDLDVVGSDIYLIGNSLQSNSAPKGGYIRLINGVPTDPIVNLKFNFSLAPAGPQSADGILNDAINGGTFGGAATFGMLAGLIGDTAALFSGAPVIDLSVSDASELARGLLKKGVVTTNLMGNVNSLIDRGAVAPPGVSFVYFGPFWTIGYDYDQYVRKHGELPPPLFPLYYYFDQNGKPVYLLNLPASPDVSQPVTPQ